MKNYNWENLNVLIKEHYGSGKSFIESLEEEKALGITYESFRKQKNRESTKNIRDYVDFIIEQHGTRLEKLKMILYSMVNSFWIKISKEKSITLRNTGSKFVIEKSFDKNYSNTINIEKEILISLKELLQSSFFKEVLEDDSLITLVNDKIEKYINKKVKLFDTVKFTISKYLVNIEIKFNKKTISFDIEREHIEELFETISLN